ncbi:hypothetical protein UY3_18917 [Chelonia mydas]|uniref:Uncharacterized protein n=1 Tax=Chelonia mydas TaxID=8469 RepID=M7AI26_CHEMY|nr:hypothetical protein UY3_18917 [Chelonia mydas]
MPVLASLVISLNSAALLSELDVILSGDPTSTAEAPVDTSVAHVPAESGPSQEKEILDEDVKREVDPEAEDDSEVRDAHSQELFSTPEEASQSQLSELGEAQTGQETPVCFRRGQKQVVQTNIPIHHEYKVPKLPPPSLASSEEDLAEAIIHPPTPSVRNQETPLTQTIGTEEKKKEPKEPELLWTNTEMDKDTELDELDKLWDSGSRLLSETEHTHSDFGRPTSSIKSNETLFSFERETDWSAPIGLQQRTAASGSRDRPNLRTRQIYDIHDR